MSSVKEYVTQFVDEYINEKILNKDVHSFLINHERKHIFISNLSRELLKAEYRPITMDIFLLKKVSHDFARIFCESALKLKAEQMMSETAKILKVKQADERKAYIEELQKESCNAIDINSVNK